MSPPVYVVAEDETHGDRGGRYRRRRSCSRSTCRVRARRADGKRIRRSARRTDEPDHDGHAPGAPLARECSARLSVCWRLHAARSHEGSRTRSDKQRREQRPACRDREGQRANQSRRPATPNTPSPPRSSRGTRCRTGRYPDPSRSGGARSTASAPPAANTIANAAAWAMRSATSSKGPTADRPGGSRKSWRRPSPGRR